MSKLSTVLIVALLIDTNVIDVAAIVFTFGDFFKIF